MKITALAPWFGAKRTIAKQIVDALGPHRVYWEPFCGSMAVLLAKPPCVMESVNDLHGDLINLARVIQHERLGSQLYRRLRRTLMHEALHREAAERLAEIHDPGGAGRGPQRRTGQRTPPPDEPDVERAYCYFLCAWLGRNGVAGTHSYNQGFCVRYTANGGHAATRWTSVIGSIPAWRWRLRNVTILARDAFELLARIDDSKGTAIYVDPPYLVKGATYVHDFAAEDHRRLADVLHRFKKARVVVSYYDHELLGELYPDWQRRHIDVTKALVNQGMRDKAGATKAREVLLINERTKQQGVLF